jgi:cell division protein ZapA
MQERLVRFTLFGQEFTFYTDAAEEEVDAVISLLREELEGDGSYGRSSVPSSKMLVLGCLRIAAKLIRLQREHDRSLRAYEETMARIMEKISSAADSAV